MIQISNLAKRYAGQILFEGVSFSINSGEKIGLVGRNGEGKSTFFKLLTGAEEADDGQISFPSGYRVGHLSQKLVFSEPTALEEALTALEGDAVWTDGHKVEAVLEGLGFDDQLKNTEPAKLSGGLQVRLNLAKLIASAPDLLLLDEPTNYLDIVSLRWLEKFLLAWRGELILITHDQGFLNKVISHTLGIHRKDFRKIAGPTSGYYSQLAMEEEVHEKSRLNQEKKIKETEKFINTFRAKASKAKAVQSRVKELEKMDKLDKLSEIDTLDFNFSHTAFPGKRMMEVREISFSWKEDQPLISDLSFTIGAKDRIGIIGKNGKGKTTLLRLLVGELQATSGEFQSAPKLESAYFGQTNVERLNQKATIEQELMSLDNCESITRARGAAGLMMFKGDDALKKISVLSGGEKSRVLLAKNILTPANILFLDEPTNHLDMFSTDALFEAVREFPGAVVMVTHSEMFLRGLVNRLVIFDRDKVRFFEGGYEDFLERVGWADEELAIEQKTKSKSVAKKPNKGSAKELRELKKEFSKLEKKIEKTEKLISETTEKLIETTKDGYGQEAQELSGRLKSSKSELEELYSSLEQAMEKIDSLSD